MKLMRLFILVCCITLLNGCSRFGDTRPCQIKGNSFEGLFTLVKDTTSTTKVLMVHGVGRHIPGYSTQLMQGLSTEMALNHISKVIKNIDLTDALDPTRKLGNLRISRLTNEDKSHELLFYELTWSEITATDKEALSYDISDEYSFRRASINDRLKKFTNDAIPDQMIYLGDRHEDILVSFQQSFCWMISKQWDDLPVTSNRACGSAQLQSAIGGMKKDHYAFISHSLGSRIIIDGLQRIAALLTNKESKIRKQFDNVDEFVQTFQQLRMPIFMLANQLPLLQLGRKLPEVTGQRDAYCRADGPHYDSRILSETDIIAFSDPNDILSYEVSYEFMDRYLDSRLCVDTTNVNLNVADVIDVFGIDFAWPIEAHNGYLTDERVISLIAYGVGNENTAPIVNERCTTLITDD